MTSRALSPQELIYVGGFIAESPDVCSECKSLLIKRLCDESLKRLDSKSDESAELLQRGVFELYEQRMSMCSGLTKLGKWELKDYYRYKGDPALVIDPSSPWAPSVAALSWRALVEPAYLDELTAACKALLRKPATFYYENSENPDNPRLDEYGCKLRRAIRGHYTIEDLHHGRDIADFIEAHEEYLQCFDEQWDCICERVFGGTLFGGWVGCTYGHGSNPWFSASDSNICPLYASVANYPPRQDITLLKYFPQGIRDILRDTGATVPAATTADECADECPHHPKNPKKPGRLLLEWWNSAPVQAKLNDERHKASDTVQSRASYLQKMMDGMAATVVPDDVIPGPSRFGG